MIKEEKVIAILEDSPEWCGLALTSGHKIFLYHGGGLWSEWDEKKNECTGLALWAQRTKNQSRKVFKGKFTIKVYY